MISWKNTLVLIVIFIILCLFAFYQKSYLVDKSLIVRNILSNEYEKFNSITFDIKSNKITCFQDENIWYVKDSNRSSFRANPEIINKLIESLDNLKLVELINFNKIENKNINLNDYGFNNSSIKISFEDNDKNCWLIGNPIQFSSNYYILKNDENIIYSISGDILNLIPSDISLFQDMRIIPDIFNIVERIDIRSELGFIEVIKNTYDDWSLINPRKVIIKHLDIMSFIDTLNNFYIYKYIDEEKSNFSSYNLDEKSTKLTFSNLSDNIHTLFIGSIYPDNNNFRYARKNNENKIFLVRTDIIDYINNSVEDFRMSRVIDTKSFRPELIYLENDNQKIHFYSSSNNLWSMKVPFEWNINTNYFNEFIEFIGNMNITNFNVKPDYELSSINLIMRSKNNEKKITYFTSYDIEKPLYVKFDDEPYMHEVNSPQLLHNYLNPLLFKDLRLFTFEKEEISYYETIVKNRSYLIDFNNLLEIDIQCLNKFSNLSADSYIAAFPSTLIDYALEKPIIRIKFRLNGSDFFGRELIIGGKTSEGRYAMIKGRDIIFIISDKNIDALLNDKQI